MPKYIHENKIYDTDTAKQILQYGTRRKETFKTVFGGTYETSYLYPTRLYKTKSGAWFTIESKRISDDWTSAKFTLITEEDAKKIVEELNDTEVYAEHFGKLEEG